MIGSAKIDTSQMAPNLGAIMLNRRPFRIDLGHQVDHGDSVEIIEILKDTTANKMDEYLVRTLDGKEGYILREWLSDVKIEVDTTYN